MTRSPAAVHQTCIRQPLRSKFEWAQSPDELEDLSQYCDCTPGQLGGEDVSLFSRVHTLRQSRPAFCPVVDVNRSERDANLSPYPKV